MKFSSSSSRFGLFASLAIVCGMFSFVLVHCSTKAGDVPTFNILAGMVNSGLGGSAQTAVFLNRVDNATEIQPDTGSLVVTSDGTVYFRDRIRGILSVNATDGTQSLVIPTTGKIIGDNGPASNGSLKDPVKIALDFSGGLLVYDFDRIRRIDTTATPMTITTIIGGGSSDDDGVGPRDVKIWPAMGLTDKRNDRPLVALPNGDIYFQSKTESTTNLVSPLRVYHAATNSVSSLSVTGTGYGEANPIDHDHATADLSSRSINAPSISFNPTTSAITSVLFEVSRNGLANVDPVTGVSTAPHPTLASNHNAYLESRITSRSGNQYVVARYLALTVPGFLSRYDATSKEFSYKLGNGKMGTCADGTIATSCAVDLSDVFVNENDKIYFVERGRIRYVDENNRVQTLMGQSLSYGDGGLATSARLNSVRTIDQTSTGDIILFDEQELKFRSFTIGGNIETIAGNGNYNDSNNVLTVGQAATGQPLLYKRSGCPWGDFVVNPLTADIFYPVVTTGSNVNVIAKFTRAAGTWSTLVGDGGTAYSSADGLAGSSIAKSFYPARILGFDGSNILALQQNFDSTLVDSFFKIYSISNGTQTHLAGVTGVPTAFFCEDGTSGAACGVPQSYNIQSSHLHYTVPRATYDTTGSRWLLMEPGSQKVRVLAVGGTMGTLANLAAPAQSFVYVRKSGGEVIYYCDLGGRIRKNDLASDVALSWPSDNGFCTGTLLYNSTRGSLIFPYVIDGMQTVAEYPNL